MDELDLAIVVSLVITKAPVYDNVCFPWVLFSLPYNVAEVELLKMTSPATLSTVSKKLDILYLGMIGFFRPVSRKKLKSRIDKV